MKKILFSSLLLTSLLSADDFEQFLQNALTHSPYLQASKLDIEVQQQQSETQLRYDNPTFGADVSRFNPDAGRDKDGYSLSLSQPIRLWGVGEDKEALASLLIKGATLRYHDKKARFIKAFSLGYVRYSQARQLQMLAEESLEISRYIYGITKRRFSAGNIAQKELLQAKTLMQKQEIQKDSLSLSVTQKYYDLLSLAGVNEALTLKGVHTFKLIEQEEKNPKLQRLQNKLELDLAKANVSAHKVESIQLNAQYEKEYEQDISALGVSFPLALFNTKSQEKKIAILKAKQTQFKQEQAQISFDILENKLSLQRENIALLQRKQEALLQTQQKLLTMFKEGYRVAKSNLLALQNAKNTLLETKKELIELTATRQQNIIETNYLKGIYHD